MRSIGNVLDESRGVGAGFDFLRIALATSVVAWHAPTIANGAWYGGTRFIWMFDYSILEVFFGLSGFLIAGSALRLSLSNFAINRSLRIVPALAVEILLSALIIGPLLTSLPLVDYFSNYYTYKYFTNIFGWINYLLPGVFDSSPDHRVNGSLWTVPYEIGCYLIMACFMKFGILKRPILIVGFAFLLLGIGLIMVFLGYRGHPTNETIFVLDNLFYGRGSRLFVSFSLGIAAYILRHKIPYSRAIFALSLCYIVLLAGLITKHYPAPIVGLLTVVPLIYMMAFLGVSKLPALPLFDRGDYSYGVYLYGWPVAQVCRTLFPELASNPWVLFFMAMPLIVLFSAFSWHAIEKPILRLRKNFSFMARKRLEEHA